MQPKDHTFAPAQGVEVLYSKWDSNGQLLSLMTLPAWNAIVLIGFCQVVGTWLKRDTSAEASPM